jgi:hypothetical protein
VFIFADYFRHFEKLFRSYVLAVPAEPKDSIGAVAVGIGENGALFG